MDREVDPARQQSLFDFLGEKTLTPGFRQRPVLDHVAGRADRLDGDVFGIDTVRSGDAVTHRPRLGQRQRTAARADAQDCWLVRGLRHVTPQCYAPLTSPFLARGGSDRASAPGRGRFLDIITATRLPAAKLAQAA